MYTENKTLSRILSLHTYHFISYSLLIEYLRDCAMRLILCVHLTQCDCAMRYLCQPTIDPLTTEFSVAQWLEYPTSVRKVVGSIPFFNSVFFLCPSLHTYHFIYYCRESQAKKKKIIHGRRKKKIKYEKWNLASCTYRNFATCNKPFSIYTALKFILDNEAWGRIQMNVLLIAKPRDDFFFSKTGKTGKFLGMRSMLLPNPF